MKLLGSNTKLAKLGNDSLNGERFLVTGLSLAPHRRSGVNFCENAGFCSRVCNLWFSGRTLYPKTRRAMMNRSRYFIEDRAGFERDLRRELTNFQRLAERKGMTPLGRLNVATDLDWSHIVDEFPGITFYDYTKVLSRVGNTPDNYHLTYSINERSDWRSVSRLLNHGFNCSVVFDSDYVPQHKRVGELPSHLMIGGKWREVVDGDNHDIRLPRIDGSGVLVGLRFKGSRRFMQEAIDAGFVLEA